MAHISTIEGQLRKILKDLLQYRWQEDGHEYRWKLLSHFHLLESNVLVNVRCILGCKSLVLDETPSSQPNSSQDSHGMNVDSLLEIRPDDKGLILNSGYKIYVPLLQAAVESSEEDKINKLLDMMDKKLELVTLWFVACLAAKRKREALVTFALDKVLVAMNEEKEQKEKKNVNKSGQNRYPKIQRYLCPWKEAKNVNIPAINGEDAEIQRCLRPWRYTVLCFLVENNFLDNHKFDKYKSLFPEDENLNWVLHCMAAFGSTKDFTNYILSKIKCLKNDECDGKIKCTPMEVAVYHDNAHFVKKLLQCPKFETNLNELIQYAAINDSTFAIKQLLEFQRNKPSNVNPSLGHQQAMPSTSKSNASRVKINEGDTAKLTTLTPLQLAALSGHANIIKILREEGKQEPNIKCETEGETKSAQLFWPVLQREDTFVNALYERDTIDDWMAGSSLDLQKCDPTQVLLKASVWHPAGFTALHFAVVFGGTECVRALLEPNPKAAAGGSENEWPIDVYAEDGEGLSPYDWAIAVDERNGNKQMQQCLKPYVDLRPNGRSNEKMRTDKARALYERARKSHKERKQMEWVDSMSMALFRRKWDEARYLAKRVVVDMDEESLDEDGGALMLQAMEAARKTIFQEYEILSGQGGKKFRYTLLPNKIAAEEVLRQLLRGLIRGRKVDVSQTASECLSLAMKYGMEELAVDLVTLANCDVLSDGHLEKATHNRSDDDMPRLLMAMEQRKDVRRALYQERQVYVDYANTLLVGAALISALAYQGWLQPPMSYGEDHELIMDKRRYFMLAFTYANNYGFTFSMGTMLAAAIGAAPLPTGELAHTKKRILSAVIWASIFLACSVTCVVVAFTCAESTVLSHHYVPPYRNYFIFNIAFTFVLLLLFFRRLYTLSFLQPLSRRVWKYLVTLFATIPKEKARS